MDEQNTALIPENMALVPTAADKDAAVIALVEQSKPICDYAATRIIASPDDDRFATEDLSLLMKTLKAVKEKQVKYTKPYKTLLDGITNVFKPVTESLDKAIAVTKFKIQTYRTGVELKRQEIEKLNREALDLAQRQAAANEGVITVDITPIPVPAEVKAVRTEVGTSGMRTNWKVEVTDITLLPKDYLIADTVKLGNVVRAAKGQIIIPGCRIYNEPSIVMNTR